SLEKEREDQVWRERLQRCQRQLKAKDEEMSRQSQYFENFKTQLQQKLSLARDREQSLQSRIYSLEKQLLNVTVSSATGLDLAQGELIQALNQENRALADRIQELLAHIELRELEMRKEQTHLRECICRLEEDGVRLEQENREQVSLISELTRKTEDDLNTIMELQQKLEESKEEPQVKQQCRTLWQSEHRDGITGCFQEKKQEEYVENLVESLVKGEKETDNLTTASSSCQLNVQDDSSQNSLHASSLTDEVAQLNTSIQSLKTEQKELTAKISSLREEQKEVTLSVQKQTEDKQRLTRSVWALKEQKDCISQSLHGLKQEKENLNRASEALREVVEKEAAEQVMRLTESAGQREDIMKENETLSMQVKELQNKLMALHREKTDALSLKAQTEEQFNILAAQLKAKARLVCFSLCLSINSRGHLFQ
ncbi:hypothetical protein GOODEAATRI_001268, partial [Goodea atripinnis]